MSRGEKYFLGVLAIFAGAWLCLHLAGCALANGELGATTNGIPNLRQVEPGVWRGGQPETPTAWSYLRTRLGLTNDIKLNTGAEASDRAAISAGFTLYYYPIDTMQQLVTGPDEAQMRDALRHVRPGTFIHCQHGEDRTGAFVYILRRTEGWTDEAARAEMMTNKFHRALFGLQEFTKHWRN